MLKKAKKILGKSLKIHFSILKALEGSKSQSNAQYRNAVKFSYSYIVLNINKARLMSKVQKCRYGAKSDIAKYRP